VSLVCVLGSFRASACVFRVSELLVVRLSFAVKLFRLRCVSCEIPKFSCRVLNSSFSFEFVVEIFVSSFVSYFEVDSRIRFLEFSKSYFEVEFRIRLFRFEFVVEIFDVLLYSTSRISLLYSTSRISLLYSTSRNRSSNSTSRISTSRVKSLEFRIRLDLFDFSNFDSNSSSKLSIRKFRCSIRFLKFDDFKFAVEILIREPNLCCYCELTSSIILARTLTLRSRCHASFARAFRA